jgi:uncharacterized membrane protein YwaF
MERFDDILKVSRSSKAFNHIVNFYFGFKLSSLAVPDFQNSSTISFVSLLNKILVLLELFVKKSDKSEEQQ